MWATTLKANSGICPCWKVPVVVHGWYKFHAENEWKFWKADCDIIENSKLPRYEQKQEYEMMSCPDPYSCPLYTEFQPMITKDI